MAAPRRHRYDAEGVEKSVATPRHIRPPLKGQRESDRASPLRAAAGGARRSAAVSCRQSSSLASSWRDINGKVGNLSYALSWGAATAVLRDSTGRGPCAPDEAASSRRTVSVIFA